MRITGILLALLLLAGCTPKGEGGDSTKTILGNIDNRGQCSVVVIINGLAQTVRGSGGSTVTAGNTTLTFSPDCSTVTTTTTAEENLLSGGLPS